MPKPNRRKGRTQITLPIQETLLRAVEMQAAREKVDRVKWINTTCEDKLRDLGKVP